MDGLRLLAAAEVNGELHLLVETTACVVRCPGCGTRAVSKGRREVRVRDLPAGGRRVVVVWRKRIWRCPDPDCNVTTWTEGTDAIELWAEHWNDDPKPFVWHKTADEIIEKVRRGRATLTQVKSATHH